MGTDPAQVEKRRRELARMLAGGRPVSTAGAARRFGVSQMTIRRDLHALEESGCAVRAYGGAVGAERITLEFAFDERRRRHLAEKRRIGRTAAERVEPGWLVLLDTGTTTLEVARALARRDTPCTVATSSLVVASELWGRGRVELLLLGGRVRRGSPDLAGPMTEIMLDRLTADVAFIGSEGVDPERGSFAADPESARVAERMAAHARRVVVVADSSKLGAAGTVLCVATEDIDDLITDARAGRAPADALRSRGVTVTLV